MPLASPSSNLHKNLLNMTAAFPVFFRSNGCFCFLCLLFYSTQLFAAQGSYESDIMKAAHGGDPESQFGLAMLYEYGSETMNRDPDQSILWLEKAGQGAVPAACLYLGLKYEYGNRVKKNVRKAACWYQCAARKDWPAAQFFLAGMYEKGKGVSQSDSMARMLFGLAAEYDYPGAAENFSRLSLRVKDKDMAQVQKMQKTFLGKDGTPCN